MAHRSSESGTGMPALSMWLVKSFISCSGTSTCKLQYSFQLLWLAQNPYITASTAFASDLLACQVLASMEQEQQLTAGLRP